MLARALYDNRADFADELSFDRGDTLSVIERDLTGAPGWWLCSLRGRQGIVPANRLQIVISNLTDDFNSSSANSFSRTPVNNNVGAASSSTLLYRNSQQQQHRQQQQQQQFQAQTRQSTAARALNITDHHHQQQQQQHRTVGSSNLLFSSPPAYSVDDPSAAAVVEEKQQQQQHGLGENTYENLELGENQAENLYEDPSMWNTLGNSRLGGNDGPAMGLLVTTTLHQNIGNQQQQHSEATYAPNSTDSGVYTSPALNNYAEDIYDFPAAFSSLTTSTSSFQQQQQHQQQPFDCSDGVYDTVPADLAFTPGGDYDFVDVSLPPTPIPTQQQQQPEYDTLPAMLATSATLRTTTATATTAAAAVSSASASADSLDTLSASVTNELNNENLLEASFESRRSVIERLVRLEHAVTRAAGRWTKLFGGSGWRKAAYLKANAQPIRSNGEQLSTAMTAFASFASMSLSRLDFATFATASTLRGSVEPLYIEATKFSKCLHSVTLVNWWLDASAPHLAKTFEVMLHSQRTFLAHLTTFANCLKRADFTTIAPALSNAASSQQLSSATTSPPPLVSPRFATGNVSSTPAQSPQSPSSAVSTVHIDINNVGTKEVPVVAATSYNEQHHRGPGKSHNVVRFEDNNELVGQLSSELEQRLGELSFVVSTFVLSLRRTQGIIDAAETSSPMPRYNGGFIECGKLLVNVAHSVVLLGDRLATQRLSDPDSGEGVKGATERLRVCIRVFVDKLKRVAGAGSRSAMAVDDLVTQVGVLRSQAEAVGQVSGLQRPWNAVESTTPTSTLGRSTTTMRPS